MKFLRAKSISPKEGSIDASAFRDDSRLRAILEIVCDGFLALDGDWRFTYVNGQAEQMLRRNDLLGKNLWEEYPGLRGTEFEEAYRRASSQHVSASVTAFYPDHDRWYEVHIHPTSDGLAVCFRDVTALKKSEEQWRAQAEKNSQQSRIFDRVLSSITDFAYIFDLNGRFTFINKPLLDLWGLTLEQAAGKNFFDLQYPYALASKLQLQIQQVIDTRQRIVDETPYTSPTGEGGYYQYIFSPIIGPDGKVEAVAGSTRDITDSKQTAAEAFAAAETNAKFRTFFDQGSYFAGVMALDGTLLEANRLCLDACGFKREEVIGKKFWECGWWSPSPALVEMIQQGLAQAVSGQIFHCETTYFIADGSERFVNFSMAPVKDDGGRVLFVAPTGIDITDKKRLFDDRERLLQAERQARTEAESANRAKDKFIAVLSHELRTPLTPVTMSIPAIESDPELPAKFREDLAMVRRNIDLEVKLIDDLLDLSRVTTGKLRLHMQPVHIHQVLTHALENSLGSMAGKHPKMHHEFNADCDQVIGDPARLQQVFWNLIRNAVKFTPETGEIFIRTFNDPQKNIFIEIRDTGVGIPPEALPRIFNAFEQGESHVTGQFGGLGLGLAIAKAVVEMHGGAIAVASEGRDRGATFSVRIATSSRTATHSRHPRPTASGVNTSRGSRVLLVEDHHDTARTLAKMLKIAGFNVKTANSAASALEVAASEPFDVMVSDIGLPDATGYELMEKIRDRYGIKGIALSGYGMEEDMRKSQAAGFVDHVVKPVNLEHLQSVIRRVTAE